MSDENSSFLVEVATRRKIGPVPVEKGDVLFPDEVRGWGDVLDCRHEPYTGFDFDDLLHRAEHAHKFYLLLAKSQLP
jgi:hypothetical protein